MLEYCRNFDTIIAYINCTLDCIKLLRSVFAAQVTDSRYSRVVLNI